MDRTKSVKQILFLIFSPRLSGAEIAMLRLCKESKQNIFVVCGLQNYSIVEEYLSFRKIFPLNFIKTLIRNELNFIKKAVTILNIFLKLNKSLSKIVLENNINVIYSNNMTFSFYAIPFLIKQKLFKKKISFIWHEHTFYIEGIILKIIRRFNYYIYDKTVVSSLAVKRIFPAKKTELLYYGINIEKYKEDPTIRHSVRDKLKIERNTIVIAIFGIISKNKGHHLLLNSLRNIKLFDKKIKILILGKSYNEEYLLNLKQNYLNDIIYENWTNQVEDYYNAIDIMINASEARTSEAFGLTIAEAMLFKKIVIASNTGGLPEIVDDKINGFLFAPDNVYDLKKKIEYVINNYNKLEKIRENARIKIVQNYQMEKMINSFDQIIGDLDENP